MPIFRDKQIKQLGENNIICVWGRLQHCEKPRLFSNLSSLEFDQKNVGGTAFSQNFSKVGNVRFEAEFWVEILKR